LALELEMDLRHWLRCAWQPTEMLLSQRFITLGWPGEFAGNYKV
jgi:hypothetical protein